MKVSKELKIVSDNKVRANRENAKHSTGPKTATGKFKSSRNSIKHGLQARLHLVIGEDPVAFERFKASYIKALSPKNIIEEQDCIQIIGLGWQLRRFPVVASGIINSEMIKQIKSEYNKAEMVLVKRADYDAIAISTDQVSEIQGLAFKRDCMIENASLKLNTMHIRSLATYHKLLSIYFERRKTTKH